MPGSSFARNALGKLKFLTNQDSLQGAPLPKEGLSVAGRGLDGFTYVGKKGDQHFILDNDYTDKIAESMGPLGREKLWEDVGWIGKDGKYLTREEALALVRKENTNADVIGIGKNKDGLESDNYKEIEDNLLKGAGMVPASGAMGTFMNSNKKSDEPTISNIPNMGTIRPVPQTPIEQLLGSTGRGIGNVRGFLNKNAGIPFVDTGIGLGDMMLGQGPELLDEMSWGKSPIIPSGYGGRLDPRVMDVVDAAGITGLAGMFGKGAVKAGIKDVVSSSIAGKKQGGYIVGAQSKLADLDALDKAVKMSEKGMSGDKIYADTKWWLDHPDGKPRFEIAHGDEDLPDFYSLIDEKDKLEKIDFDELSLDQKERRSALRMLMQDDGMLKDRVKNSPIPDHYPAYNDIKFVNEPADSNSLGTYYKPENGEKARVQFKDTGNKFDDKRTMQHEIQHSIAEEEGFAPGGNSSMISNYLKSAGQNVINHYKKAKKDGFKLTGKERLWIRDAKKDVETFGKSRAFGPYQALMDEAQARLVESRSYMTLDQMLADPFYKNYPVDLNKMIDMRKVEVPHDHQTYLDMRKRIMQNAK